MAQLAEITNLELLENLVSKGYVTELEAKNIVRKELELEPLPESTPEQPAETPAEVAPEGTAEQPAEQPAQ